MNKALVQKIIAAGKFDESDAAWLEQLGDDQGAKLAAHCGVDTADEGGKDQPAGGDAAAPVAHAAAKLPTTVDEWLALAPNAESRELFIEMRDNREMYSHMRAKWDAEETELRKEIIAHTGGIWTDDELKGKPRRELEKLHTSTKPKASADYSGRGVAIGDPVAHTGTTAPAPRMPGIAIGG